MISTLSSHRCDTLVSYRCLIDVDPNVLLSRIFLSGTLRYLMNYQSHYLSWEPGIRTETFLQTLGRQLSSVIITEYLDASLILLRRKFCWDFRDMLYITLRSRKYRSKNNPPSTRQITNHQRFSSVDYAVYRFFVNRLKSDIQSQNHTFYEELNMFKRIRKNMRIFCDGIQENLHKNASAMWGKLQGEHIEYNPSPWGNPFVITGRDCAMMRLKTIVHRNLMKMRQFPHLCQESVRHSNELNDDIRWDDDGKLVLHKAYCGERDGEGIATEVLTHKDAYMWTT